MNSDKNKGKQDSSEKLQSVFKILIIILIRNKNFWNLENFDSAELNKV